MGMTGIQILKFLPKTNCGECGVPTCLAFAMQLATGKAELEKCPYVAEESKAKLAASAAPPVRPLTVGTGEYAVKVGGETVSFRHEKTFVNPPGLACLVSSDEAEASIQGKIDRFKACQFERVGLNLRPEMFALKDASNDPATYKAFVQKFMGLCDASLILICPNPDVMAAALEVAAERKPLLYAVTLKNGPKMAKLAKDFGCPAVVRGDGNMDTVIKLTENLGKMGLKDLVIDTGTREPHRLYQELTLIRRSALATFRPLGYPTIVFPCEMASDLDNETLLSALYIAKYGSFIVMSDFQAHSLFPLLLSRLNIYTDPQRPMTAEQGIYPIGNPDENSPVLVTSNFSLTYFIVSGEIESSRVPAWLLVQDTEGLSVLTAWAAGKFNGETVGTFVKKSGIADKISQKKVIIPGYAAAISGELEEELGGWQVVVGPREASQIPKFLKTL